MKESKKFRLASAGMLVIEWAALIGCLVFAAKATSAEEAEETIEKSKSLLNKDPT